jgi:DNA invertase Pin-like site-specific DNA recombinase
MLKDAVRAKFDVLMCWDVSRLGRSLSDLVQALEEFHANGIDLYLHQQAIDTTTPSGKAMFQMCGVFAEFERAMIRERVIAGLALAKLKGKKLGRPRIASMKAEKVKYDRSQGLSVRAIAAKHGISVGTTHQLLQPK